MVAVTTIEPLDGYQLRLIFNDGSERVVDLTADLWGPMGEPLRDPAVFRQVRVDPELRTIVWPNGFDLDPDVLHNRSSQDVSPDARAAGRVAAHRTNVLPTGIGPRCHLGARSELATAVVVMTRSAKPARHPRPRRTHRTRKGGVRRHG